MPHVELSISQPAVSVERPAARPATLTRWAETVAAAVEPCLVIDARTLVVAMSPSCVHLLGLKKAPLGKPAHRAALRLIDFNASAAPLTDVEVSMVPPLLSLSSGRLARALIRIESAGGACTLDAVSSPLGEEGGVVGSLTFFSPV